MYLTAHHVKARDGASGINAYLHRHSSAEESRIGWEHPDIKRIADEIPGSDIAQSVEIKPGGNSVLSYLDIAVPESAEPDFLADSLRLFEHYVREGRFPAVFTSNRLAMRFGLIMGLQKLALAEFRRLRARALQLLGDTSESKVHQVVARAASPLKVIVTRDDAGEVYQLASESAARVAAVRPEFGPAVRIRISNDTRSDFQTLVGDVYPHIVTSLTGLSRAQIGQIGGAEVIQGPNRVWQMAPAGDIPGQLLGVWIRGGEPLPSADLFPNGAILPLPGAKPGPDSFLALDLVRVQDIWLPLSEAGVYTYPHSTGLVAGEPWAFVTRPDDGSVPLVFDAMFAAEKLSLEEVGATYGATVADRARPDYRTMQLQLRRREQAGSRSS
ncbi:MAG TPA: hypothetical protein VNO30_11710 [Kofleriaceae bacterium]|nr:hypothetical protein [Kofleriaceae bacterium]